MEQCMREYKELSFLKLHFSSCKIEWINIFIITFILPALLNHSLSYFFVQTNFLTIVQIFVAIVAFKYLYSMSRKQLIIKAKEVGIKETMIAGLGLFAIKRYITDYVMYQKLKSRNLNIEILERIIACIDYRVSSLKGFGRVFQFVFLGGLGYFLLPIYNHFSQIVLEGVKTQEELMNLLFYPTVFLALIATIVFYIDYFAVKLNIFNFDELNLSHLKQTLLNVIVMMLQEDVCNLNEGTDKSRENVSVS